MGRILHLSNCTGATPSETLKHQLIAAGLIKDSSEWGSGAEEDPTSVFWHFKHYAAQGYRPDSFLSKAHLHCGVCNHDIEYQYRFVSKTGHSFGVPYIKPDGEAIIIEYPEKMYSGSVCIHLDEELKGLVRWLCKEYGVDHFDFDDGRIDFNSILKSAKKSPEVGAFPLVWFYFDVGIRNNLIWKQWSGKLGAHVEHVFKCKDYMRKLARARKFYTQNIACEELWTRTRLSKDIGVLQTPTQLFYGRDKFNAITTRHTPEQTCSPNKYVVLTRDQFLTLKRIIHGC